MKLKEKWSNLNGRQKQVAVIGSVAGVAAFELVVQQVCIGTAVRVLGHPHVDGRFDRGRAHIRWVDPA